MDSQLKCHCQHLLIRPSLEAYKPGAIGRLLGAEKNRRKLESAVEDAVSADNSSFQNAHRAWNAEMLDWQESVDLAKKVIAGDPEAKAKAIGELNNFSQISELGSSISFSCSDTGTVEASINVHGLEVIPTETKSLLQSGRLSIKQMPKGRFNELHQDYVCSSLIRVANELFALLPDERVFVTATDKLLNSATGHLDDVPIVSACITRQTLESLNLGSIDPSDAMGNFVHNMVFKKTQGFQATSRVDPAQISA